MSCFLLIFYSIYGCNGQEFKCWNNYQTMWAYLKDSLKVSDHSVLVTRYSDFDNIEERINDTILELVLQFFVDTSGLVLRNGVTDMVDSSIIISQKLQEYSKVRSLLVYSDAVVLFTANSISQLPNLNYLEIINGAVSRKTFPKDVSNNYNLCGIHLFGNLVDDEFPEDLWALPSLSILGLYLHDEPHKKIYRQLIDLADKKGTIKHYTLYVKHPVGLFSFKRKLKRRGITLNYSITWDLFSRPKITSTDELRKLYKDRGL